MKAALFLPYTIHCLRQLIGKRQTANNKNKHQQQLNKSNTKRRKRRTPIVPKRQGERKNNKRDLCGRGGKRKPADWGRCHICSCLLSSLVVGFPVPVPQSSLHPYLFCHKNTQREAEGAQRRQHDDAPHSSLTAQFLQQIWRFAY